LAVDDAHWADDESLRWIAHAIGRLEGLAVGVLIATRPFDPGGGSPLAEVAAEGLAHMLRLGPLGKESVGTMVRHEFGTAPDPAFVTSCAEATAGNPFALRELLRDLRVDGVEPTSESCERLVSHAPDRLARVALVRLARVGAESVAMARALAVLAGEAELALVASLAGLDIAAAALGADSLVRADFLADERPLRFVHPLLRAAVYDDIPRGRRGLEHARAAQLLRDRGAAAEEIAAHLLLTEPGDGESLASLRKAARNALARGATRGAVAYLRRALREAMTPDLRAELLHELGAAEAVARDPSAVTDLREALSRSRDPSRRARIAAELAEILILGTEWDTAMELVGAALSELDEGDVETRARSSTHSTTARSGGFRYRPTTSRTLATNWGSLDSVQLPWRWGWSPNACQILSTAFWVSQTSRSIDRVDQCVASAGTLSNVLVITSSTCPSVIVRGRPAVARPSAHQGDASRTGYATS
jgi:hypothetical protein